MYKILYIIMPQVMIKGEWIQQQINLFF